MFHSFHANREHRDFLRFPLLRDNKLNDEICEYRTTVHLLGALWLIVSRQFGLNQLLKVVKAVLSRNLQTF